MWQPWVGQMVILLVDAAVLDVVLNTTPVGEFD